MEPVARLFPGPQPKEKRSDRVVRSEPGPRWDPGHKLRREPGRVSSGLFWCSSHQRIEIIACDGNVLLGPLVVGPGDHFGRINSPAPGSPPRPPDPPPALAGWREGGRRRGRG